MKRSSTFHLEEDIYDIIDDYKDKYGLTSRNDALTRLLIEYRTMLFCNGQERSEKIVKKETTTDAVLSDNVVQNSEKIVKDDTNIVKNNTKNDTVLSDNVTIESINEIKDNTISEINDELKSEISSIINNSYDNMPE